MAMTARRTLAFGRWTGGVRRIVFRGIDLTAFASRMQVRLTPDTPGVPLLDLAMTTNPDATGLRLLPLVMDGAVPVSTLLVQILKVDLGTKLPPAATTGDDATFAWDLTLKLGNNIDQAIVGGGFVVAAGVTGADGAVAPAGGSAGTAYQTGSAGDVGLISIGDTVVQVSIEGIDLLAPVLAAAKADGIKAETAAAAAAASAALVRMEIQATANTLDATADPSGRWSHRVAPDGGLQVQKLIDADGRDLIRLLDGSIADLATVQQRLALLPPIQIQRLKAAVYRGTARTPMAADPIVVGAFTTASTIANGSPVPMTDSRLRYFGARYVKGADSSFNGRQYFWPQSTTNGNPSEISGITGLPKTRIGVGGLEFVAQPGWGQFELILNGTADNGRFSIEIDGVATNANGYPMGPNSDGARQHYLVTLPASAVARRIRIWTNGRGVGGLVLQPGGSVTRYVPPIGATMAVIGDSVTQGAVAQTIPLGWAAQCGYRLGIDNIVVSGVGGSGYLAKVPASGYNFRERIGDALTAIDGGPPDLLLIAGGVNDISVVDSPSNPYTIAQLAAEALTYVQQLRAAAPDTVIGVLGPWTDYNNAAYSQHSRNAAAALFAAVSQVSRVFTVDVSDIASIAQRDQIWNGQVDGIHPLDFGHALYGEKVARKVATAIAAL